MRNRIDDKYFFIFKVALRNQYFFQVVGEKRISIGNSSSLPANISNIKISFDGTEKNAKLPVGPTASSPGPILFMVAVTAVKLVTRLCPSSDSNRSEAVNTTIYHAM